MRLGLVKYDQLFLSLLVFHHTEYCRVDIRHNETLLLLIHFLIRIELVEYTFLLIDLGKSPLIVHGSSFHDALLVNPMLSHDHLGEL